MPVEFVYFPKLGNLVISFLSNVDLYLCACIYCVLQIHFQNNKYNECVPVIEICDHQRIKCMPMYRGLEGNIKV